MSLTVVVVVPGLKLFNPSNRHALLPMTGRKRNHWAADRAESQLQKDMVRLALVGIGTAAKRELLAAKTVTVRITRVGGRKMDVGGACAAVKWVQTGDAMGIPFDHPAIADAVRNGLISPEKLGCSSERTGAKVRQKERPAERCERPTGLTATDPVTEGHAMADEQPTSTSAQNQPAQFRPDPTARLNEVPAECVVVRATHFGEPTAKARARYDTRSGRMYTPRNTKVHQQALADAAGLQLAALTPDKGWAWGIRAVFYVGTHQRKDTDNMLKAVLDAMNRKVFADDHQVKETMSWSVLDITSPRTEFIVYRMYPIDREQGQCVQCGKTFRRYKSWKARRYCSRWCNTLATTRSTEHPCASCGKLVLRPPARVEQNVGGEFFCSGGCRSRHGQVTVECGHCGVQKVRQKSSLDAKQGVYFCGVKCTNAARTGAPKNITREAASAATHRAWVTRRAKKSPLASGEGTDRNGDAPPGANFDGGPPVAG